MPSVYEYATEWTEKDLKKEYTRLRNQFQKQIGRLAQVDLSQKVQAFLPGGYKFQRTIKDIEQLRGRKNWSEKARKEDWARRVAELQQLTEARSLSLSGRKKIRQETIQSLKEQGFENINNKNFDKFTSFMNWAKRNGVLDEYESNQVAESFDQWIAGGIVDDEELGALIQEWEDTVESVDLFD